MYDLLIEDATIIRSDGRRVVDIAIEDGRIAYIGDNPAGRARETVLAIGRFVMPGAIELDARLVGQERWASLSRAAAASGVTTVLLRGLSGRDAIQASRAAAEAESIVGAGFWCEATEDNHAEAEALYREGLTCGVSVELAEHSADSLARCFAEGAALLSIRAEDPAQIAAGIAAHRQDTDPEHNDVRPPQAALSAVESLVEIVRDTGRRVHLEGVSTAAELAALELVRGELPITCGVTPNHLFLSVETVRALREVTKIVPPVRAELDRRALWSFIKRGRVDVFSSGHVPWTRAEKARPYWERPAGLPGLDAVLRLLLSSVKSGRLGIEQLAEMTAEAPARICGLANKGRIEVGADADLVLFREGETARFVDADIHSAAGWSPYTGRELAGPPMLVVIGGKIVAQDGRLRDVLPVAQPVRFDR